MNTAQQGNYLPLGYVKVVILCYALPTFGDRILARINLSKFNFKTINFEIDRLTIENTLDNTSNKYLLFNKQNIRVLKIILMYCTMVALHGTLTTEPS